MRCLKAGGRDQRALPSGELDHRSRTLTGECPDEMS